MIRSALLTVLTLFGGLAVGFLVGSALYGVLPGSTIENPLPMHITIAALPGFLGGGAAWGVSAWAIGRGLRDNALAWSLFWRVGLAAGGAFLAVNLIMQAAGWVVGAPGAAERATMLTVMGLGNIGAALGGGGVMGQLLAR